jgi:hypothetical protein
MPSILPPLSLGESLETTKIHSVAGKLGKDSSLIAIRPFRSPHHTISQVAMVGGGTNPQPGEISLAHNGVLFLDEIDANLSGKESDAISKVLIKLSKNYQIFAISHQIQLASQANQHFLVEKIDGNSVVTILDSTQRAKELARMISGENVTNEALDFVKNLLKSQKI